MSEMRPEQCIAAARASVMVYDDVNKQWIPAGSAHGLSKVQIYHHLINNSFRVVGRKLQDQEVVINCAILKTLKYNQATETFHQWRDNKHVYGLNFSSKDDGDVFASAMMKSLGVLNSGECLAMRAVPPIPSSTISGSNIGPISMFENNHNMSVMMRNNHINKQQQQQPLNTHSVPQFSSQQPEQSQQLQNEHFSVQQQKQQHFVQQQQHRELLIQQEQQQQLQMQQKQISYQQQHPVYQQPHQHSNELIYDGGGSTGCGSEVEYGGSHGSSHYGGSDGGYDMGGHVVSTGEQRRLSLQQQQQRPVQSGVIHVNSSPNMSNVNSPHRTYSAPPPAPPPPPVLQAPSNGVVVPPPPPPPMPISHSSEQVNSGLAAALQATKLRKTNMSGNGSVGSSGYGTIGRSTGGKESTGGMASMIDEMQRTLARRRAKVDKEEEETSSGNSSCAGGSNTRRGGFLDKTGSPGSESPNLGRRRFKTCDGDVEGGGSNRLGHHGMLNGTTTHENTSHLEAMKQEILSEMRKEMNKLKQDIIEAIRLEVARR